jgi:quercetin dioxygenase-like cupin family protein
MTAPPRDRVRHAEVVLGCDDLDQTLAFFLGQLGFRLDVISPADDPAIATLSGYGLRVRLERGTGRPPGTLRLLCADPAAAGEVLSPNGTRVVLAPADPPLVLPDLQPELVVTAADPEARWHPGRAAMGYRDLIPSRLGGRFIASHIRIPDAGPVPDYVHYHKVRFQLIYCLAGWTRLVYEDQGEPFVLEAGDCVLQPPEIRHRVLEASAGLEVLEVGCPAVHDTHADHDLTLPNRAYWPERKFSGQRFVRHVARDAPWLPWRVAGFQYRESGIGEATEGLGGVRTVQVCADAVLPAPLPAHDAEFVFFFVVAGRLALTLADGTAIELERGASLVLPAGVEASITGASADLDMVEVSLPDQF